jgi:hypothetical protein
MDHNTCGRWASGWAAAAAMALVVGCGGGGGGGSGAAGSGSATISGNVSNQSTALRMRPPATLLASLWHWLSPVSDAVAGREGIQITVSGIDTTTDSTGSFTMSGGLSGSRTITFSNGSETFTVTLTVPEDSTVVLRDVELGSDGHARPGQVDTYLRGTVGAASCSTTPQTLTVALSHTSVTVDLGPDTKIKGTGSVPASSCADLASAVGQPVRVDAITQSDGTLLAERVKLRSHEANPANEIGLRGPVTATNCPSSITVGRPDGQSVTVNLTDATELEDVSSCADLAGQHVKVKGTLESDGSVTASEIEVADQEEEGNEGRRHFDDDGHEGTPTPGTPTPTATGTVTETATPTPTETPTPSV